MPALGLFRDFDGVDTRAPRLGVTDPWFLGGDFGRVMVGGGFGGEGASAESAEGGFELLDMLGCECWCVSEG